MNGGFFGVVIVLQLIASTQCETILILTSVNNDCPGEVTSQCTTLQEFASIRSQVSLLETDVILELQPGNHSLSTQLSVANIENFTVIGKDSQVVCAQNSGGFSLTSIQNIFITRISFIKCYQNVLSRNGDSVVIRNVEFRQNRGNLIESVNTVMIAIRLCIRCK